MTVPNRAETQEDLMIMFHQYFKNSKLSLLLLCIFSWGIFEANAQQRGGTQIGNARTGGGGRLGAAGAYPSNGQIGEAMITSDPETRRLIIITDSETNDQITQIITSLDRPKPQVLIKVLFLEVTHNNSLDFGVEGSYNKKINNSTTGTVADVFGAAATGATAINPGGIAQVMGSDYQVTLRAAAEQGRLEVLSRPSILARNNQQAVISIGQSVPLPSGSNITGNGVVSTGITYQDVGIILRVTPFITSDGLVEMIVAPEISTLTSQSVQISETVSAPVIARRYAETVVVTPHGQTVIIGGLMGNQKTETVKKIPLLGDIPYLGNLFKRTITENEKTELVIFLTPYVVADPSQLAQLTRQETDKSQLNKGSFTEEELNKFIDTIPSQPEKPAPAQGVQPGLPSGRRR